MSPRAIFNVNVFLIFALQVGLAFGDWILGTVEGIATSEVSGSWYLCVDNHCFQVVPVLSSIRRSARKIRRAGERKSGPFRLVDLVFSCTR